MFKNRIFESPRPYANHRDVRAVNKSAGFTLVEVLVTVGIIALLVALVLPAVMHARTTGYVIRTKSDFQAIAMALEAYKGDFGDYPRVPAYGTGFAILGNTLIAPGGTAPPPTYDSSKTYGPGTSVLFSGAPYLSLRKTADPSNGNTPASPTNSDFWTPFPYNDFCDGPGFRVRKNVTASGVYTGKVYGPYLSPEKFKMQGLALLDLWGNPILYFPAAPGQHPITLSSDSAASPDDFVWDGRDTTASPAPTPLYDFSNNFALMGTTSSSGFTSPQVMGMQQIMGDRNFNGHIDGSETATYTGPYILWSAGPDGIYGFATGKTKTDDIFNFDIPADLKQ
jgi:prepilin-type N-terminal cleavage/methylation domain-containing protein